MSPKYIIVAGPQAAGKSTFINYIAGKKSGISAFSGRAEKTLISWNGDIIPFQESRQIVVHKYGRKGAIFMSYLDEIEVIHNDMTRMFTILREASPPRLYVDECNVFTLGHAAAHGIDLLEGYYRQYCDMLGRLNARVIFLDVPPEISWERRRERYEKRLADIGLQEREETLARHRDYLERLYPELIKIYERLDFPKIRIDSTHDSKRVLELQENAFLELSGLK